MTSRSRNMNLPNKPPFDKIIWISCFLSSGTLLAFQWFRNFKLRAYMQQHWAQATCSNIEQLNTKQIRTMMVSHPYFSASILRSPTCCRIARSNSTSPISPASLSSSLQSVQILGWWKTERSSWIGGSRGWVCDIESWNAKEMQRKQYRQKTVKQPER